MEITYQTGAYATSSGTSPFAASAAVRLTTPHVVSGLRGELCPQSGSASVSTVPGTGVMRTSARPRAMELGAVLGTAARWVTGGATAAAAQHQISDQISALVLTTDVAAAKRDVNGTNGFAKQHPGSRTLRPPV